MLACLQDEMRIGNYKHKISSSGKDFGKVIDGYIFHSFMHDSLAVLHWQVHVAILSDLCFDLKAFKTRKYFQTVSTKFLKYKSQCMFNKKLTKARLPVMLTKSSRKHLDLLIWVTSSFALEFPENGFLYKMMQWRQSVVYEKKTQTTSGEASFLWYNLGTTSLYKPENLLQPAMPAVAVLTSRKIWVHLFVVKA